MSSFSGGLVSKPVICLTQSLGSTWILVPCRSSGNPNFTLSSDLTVGRLDESTNFGLQLYVVLRAVVLWCASRAHTIRRQRSRTCCKLPRVFFCFSDYHATAVNVFSVFDTVPRLLLRGPLGEALVDMRGKKRTRANTNPPRTPHNTRK